MAGEMENSVQVIAIDGPVAAGKTVVGRRLAQRLGFDHLDTGNMYRAITWLALHQNVPVSDDEALGKLAEDNPIGLDGQGVDHVVIGGHRLGPQLRASEITGQVSLVSKVSPVRRALVRQQRELASKGNIVMIGRDIGTVVLPNADLKVYLRASAEGRAKRRWLEMQAQGSDVSLQQVLQETQARDEIDSGREDSPLMQAHDAFLLDTDGLDVEQVVDRIMQRIQHMSGASRP